MPYLYFFREKEVYVHRLIVRNTIEERQVPFPSPFIAFVDMFHRMLRLQDTKVG